MYMICDKYRINDDDVDSTGEMADKDTKGAVLVTRNNGILTGYIVDSDNEGLYIECLVGETIFLPFENIGALYR